MEPIHSGENNDHKQLYVVLNPIAGQSDAETLQKALDETFAQEGWTLEVYETTGEEDVAELTRAAVKKGAKLVVAAGGDGTVAGVVNGLVNSGIPLGILPVGTGNGLARALGIPLEVEDALALLTGEHEIVRMDAMQVGDTYYILNVSAGISAQSMRETPAEQKRRFGMLAYAKTIITQIFGFQPRRFSLTLDNHQVQVQATEVLVSNGALLKEPPFPLGPRERFNDGMFDIYIVTASNLADYIRILWDLIFNRTGRKKELRTLTAKEKVTIDGGRRQYTVQADGEVIGRTPVEVRVAPSAVAVIAPRQDGETGKDS